MLDIFSILKILRDSLIYIDVATEKSIELRFREMRRKKHYFYNGKY
jgi:hypothetical protein